MNLKPNHKWLRIQLELEHHAKFKSFCALAGKTQEAFIYDLLLDYEKQQRESKDNT